MNVVVVGGGAVGSLLAWALATGGASVTLVRRRSAGPRSARIVAFPPHEHSSAAEVMTLSSIESLPDLPDAVFLAVKAYDVEAAVASLPPALASAVVTVQNGIGSEETVLERRPGCPLIAASLTASVELDSEGFVRWRRKGGIGLSPVAGDNLGLVEHLAAAFSRAGLPARAYPAWRAMKWSKLVGNLVANATSALLDMAPSEIYADARLFVIERAQLREAFAVVRALGLQPVALPGANVRLLEVGLALPAVLSRPVMARVVGSARGGKDPSLRLGMATDADPGIARRSEIGWLNGAVARTGSSVGVQTPVNAALTDLVDRSMTDAELRARLRRRPAALVSMIGGVARS